MAGEGEREQVPKIMGVRTDSTPKQEEEEEDETLKKMMKPWEQHSAVISIPRFNYNAPSSLLRHSHSGFLVTCPIKREKSATKEAMPIFEKCLLLYHSDIFETSENSNADVAAKRRKLSSGGNDGESKGKNTTEISKDFDAGKLPEDSCLSDDAKSDKNLGSSLSLVKLTKSGLLLFTFPKDNSPNVVDLVLKIVELLESGSMRPPLWCHRIFPFQATCSLNEKELRAVVTKLVLQFVNDRQKTLVRPIKFAVGYNRRGMEETELKGTIVTSTNTDALALLDRSKCFDIVAGAVKGVVPDSVVDLKCPELSVLVEMLPLSRVPNGSLVVAVSILPNKLVATKPRLCVKALAKDIKAKNGKKEKS